MRWHDSMTVGQLDASDLGYSVEISDGGATYVGELRFVSHRPPFIEGTPARTQLSLREGEWSHNGTYDHHTPCRVWGGAPSDDVEGGGSRRLPIGRCDLSDPHEAHVFLRAFTVATDPIPDVMQHQTLWCPGGVA